MIYIKTLTLRNLLDLVDTAGATAGPTKPRGARGVQKAKKELKQNNQIEAGLKVVKDVGGDINNISHNVSIIRKTMAKKHQRKYKAEIIKVLERKYDMMKQTNPVEAEVILKKINQKYDERLEELENDGNDVA